mmetsp:Transcript_14764/g.36144  ORF Transcript_14764/g.36144 Transcript_14764/m.36144 type:complete len:208 (+) Transcript_14764:260-883(+)
MAPPTSPPSRLMQPRRLLSSRALSSIRVFLNMVIALPQGVTAAAAPRFHKSVEVSRCWPAAPRPPRGARLNRARPEMESGPSVDAGAVLLLESDRWEMPSCDALTLPTPPPVGCVVLSWHASSNEMPLPSCNAVTTERVLDTIWAAARKSCLWCPSSVASSALLNAGCASVRVMPPSLVRAVVTAASPIVDASSVPPPPPPPLTVCP